MTSQAFRRLVGEHFYPVCIYAECLAGGIGTGMICRRGLSQRNRVFTSAQIRRNVVLRLSWAYCSPAASDVLPQIFAKNSPQSTCGS
jgi:hypothetical protein